MSPYAALAEVSTPATASVRLRRPVERDRDRAAKPGLCEGLSSAAWHKESSDGQS